MKRSSNDDSRTAAALDLHGHGRLSDDETVPGCFEFHHRTRSFDLHQSPSRNKLPKFANLLKSWSDGGSVKSNCGGHLSSSAKSGAKESPTTSPRTSPGTPTRRRFMRVVRDSPEADLDNPHVVHKYSSEYLSNMQKSMSAEESHLSQPPYTVTGHTILKRQQPIGSSCSWKSADQIPTEMSSPSMLAKHASFRDEVEVMEYDRKEKIRRGPIAKHKVRLHDSPVSSMEEEEEEEYEENYSTEKQVVGEMGEKEKRVTFGSASSCLGPDSSSDVPSDTAADNTAAHAHIFTSVAAPPDALAFLMQSKERTPLEDTVLSTQGQKKDQSDAVTPRFQGKDIVPPDDASVQSKERPSCPDTTSQSILLNESVTPHQPPADDAREFQTMTKQYKRLSTDDPEVESPRSE